MLELSLNDIYTELIADPDLRRLGRYKVIAAEGQTIFPIDLDLTDFDIHLGEGDYTSAFVALCNTKARSINFGSSKFLDLYLDNTEFDECLLLEARASRLYFDFAAIKECRFGKFIAPEVYFDSATIGTIAGEHLRTGIVYVENLECPTYTNETLTGNGYRFIEGSDSEQMTSEVKQDSHPEQSDTPIRRISTHEFIEHLKEDPDLSRLGSYKVVSKLGDEIMEDLQINIDFDQRRINLGEGDFSTMRMYLGASRASLIDFSKSKFDSVNMGSAEIANCFFAESRVRELRFGDARIANIFGEQCRTEKIYLDRLACHQFNVNEIRAKQLRLGEAHLSELYLSRGEGVETIYCDHAELELLNLHEGKIREFHFGDSHIGRALVNKASIAELYVENLRAHTFYIDNACGNEIGRLEFSQITGIDHISLERALYSAEGERQVIGHIEGLASPLEHAILPETEQSGAEIQHVETQAELPEKKAELSNLQEGEGPRETRGN